MRAGDALRDRVACMRASDGDARRVSRDAARDAPADDELQEADALYAGCISGALQKEDYLQIVADAGFEGVVVKDEMINDVPDEYLLESVSQEAIDAYRKSGAGIYSITVVADKF